MILKTRKRIISDDRMNKVEIKPTCNSSITDSVKGCWRLTLFPSSLTTCRAQEKIRKNVVKKKRNKKDMQSKQKSMEAKVHERTHKLQ